mgnify:CR=1 FL=1
MSRAATTATTAISPRGRTSSSTGSSSRSCPTRWPISRDAGTARHADQRQLRAQYHHRSMGRRRAGRDRGSARLGGTAAPAPDAASGILVPAAQVQDRGHRRGARPRRGQGARHRPAAAPQRRGRGRLRGDRRRRARAHAVHRQDHQAVPAEARSARATSRRSCASTISTAGATTSTRRASRSWCTSSARSNSPARSKRNGSRSRTARLRSIPPWSPRSPRASAIRLRAARRTIPPELRAARSRGHALRALARQLGRQPQGRRATRS